MSQEQSSEQLILFAEDFPVSHFQQQGSEQARQMTAISGRRCYESSKPSGRLGLLAKMLVESCRWGSNKVTLIWKVKQLMETKKLDTMEQMGLFGESSLISSQSVTPSKYFVYQLQQSTPRTKGKECGSLVAETILLTPTATERVMDLDAFKKRMEKYPNGTTMPNIATQISTMLPTLIETPQAMDGQGEGRPPRLKKDCNRDPEQDGSWRYDLKDKIAMLPTPAARDTQGARGAAAQERKGNPQDTLPNLMAMLPTPKARDYMGMTQRGIYQPGDAIPNTLEKMNRDGTSRGLKLQPGFALWMMGFPTDWLDLEGGEMPRSKQSVMQ